MAIFSSLGRCYPGLAWVVVAGVLLSGCNVWRPQGKLSSGLQESFYSRLGEKISEIAQTDVNVDLHSLNSAGSVENLARLEAKEVDFALSQLDVAVAKMRQRQLQGVAVLGSEPIHILTTKASGIREFSQLNQRRIGIGTAGSGVNVTARTLLGIEGITFISSERPWQASLDDLLAGEIDAFVYVGSLGASLRLRDWLQNRDDLYLIPLSRPLINYLTIRDPDAYQPALIPQGTYRVNPPFPPRDIPTLSTATVLVTRPDVDAQLVGLVTWGVLDSAREFGGFYPEIQTGDPQQLLQQGLFYLHPAAADVYKSGDPRSAWARYWENNHDLQAGVLILLISSGLGILFRYYRFQRSQKLMSTTTKRISRLKELLPDAPDQALAGLEALNQEQRLMFIDGKVSADVYDQAQHKTQRFAEQCQVLIQEKRNQAILNTLLLVDEWQATLQTCPSDALDKLKYLREQYRQMLIANQVNIQDYIELMELTLMSLTTFAPTYIQQLPGPPTHPEPVAPDQNSNS